MNQNLLKTFLIPAIVLIGIFFYLILNLIHIKETPVIAVSITILGSYRLFWDSFKNLIKKHFALDYIAILAISVSVFTHEYLVAMILALMISSGRTLEDYGAMKAKESLTKLAERIPNEISLWANGKIGERVNIAKVKIGDQILIRKGEVVGLDGVLISENAVLDESSLTGEPYAVEKIEGDSIRSGTINLGDPIVIKVIKTQEDSTYRKIIDMVKKAQSEKSPMVRLADKYSVWFTAVTLGLTGTAYILSNFNLDRALAVLVIATPCPLIIATPIALLGGVSFASKKHIIVKKLASLEMLAKAKAIIFDKTGTITLGKPKVVEFNNLGSYKDSEILGISAAIERNSLHPLAKAIVDFVKQKRTPLYHAQKIQEKVGVGITGVVKNTTFSLEKSKEKEGMAIGIKEGDKILGIFRFEDQIKEDSKSIIKSLEEKGLELFIFTGDKKAAADKIVKTLGANVKIKAEATPQDKQEGIKKLKDQGKITAMIGDGINDAPALALSDVGMVFSNEEQTAASEAADIVFLGGNFSQVLDSMNIAKRTISIAMQSILWGIGISIGGMVLASFGLIPPIGGAFLQEGIDVAVIINALRASR